MAQKTRRPRKNRRENQSTSEDILDGLVRVIEWSDSHTLAFVRCNSPIQREEMAQKLKARLKDKRLLEVTLDRPIVSLLDQITSRWDAATPPDAVCVYGLEASIGEEREYSPVLGRLNHDRDLIRRAVPVPMLLWLPDFALDYVARGAPDFWAWRSGVYEFATDTVLWEHEAVAALSTGSSAIFSLPLEDKLKEIARLEALLAAARALPRQGGREQEIIANSLQQLATLHYSLGDYEAARQELEESFKIYRQTGDPLGQANALGNIGLTYVDQGRLEEALEHCQKALEIFKGIGDPMGQASTLNNIGLVYRDQGKLEEAMESHQAALEIHRQVGNPLGQASALGNMGVVYRNQRRLEEALASHQKALEIHTQIGNTLGQANALGNLGVVYRNQGRLKEALESYQAALEIFKGIGNPLGQASTLVNMGVIYHQQGKREEALEHCLAALEIHTQVGNPLGQASALNNISLVYCDQGKLEQALESYLAALEIFRRLESPQVRIVEQALERLRERMGEEAFGVPEGTGEGEISER